MDEQRQQPQRGNLEQVAATLGSYAEAMKRVD